MSSGINILFGGDTSGLEKAADNAANAVEGVAAKIDQVSAAANNSTADKFFAELRQAAEAATLGMSALALSLAADAAGVLSVASQGRFASSGVLDQLLLVPQMLLVMLSSGMAPVDSFPDWLHPFVRYQPVSQVTQTLRGFTTGHVVVSNLATSLAWCLGLLVVFGAIAVRVQRRPQ